MKKVINICLIVVFCSLFMTSCLYHNIEELENSSNKELTNVEYSYRFLYNDTIQKGTVNEEIEKDRVCEVIFNKQIEPINEQGVLGFKTTLTYDLNSVQKAGPSGSVTKEMLYEMFKQQINVSGLSKLWVYVSISDAASIVPLDDAPKLGTPGDFSKDHYYRVTAADGSSADYVLKTVRGF